MAGSLAEAVVQIAGKLLACAQSLPGPLIERRRRLTEAEMTDIRRVFRSSLAHDNIRVVEGIEGLFSTSDRPFVLGDTVYSKNCDATRESEKLVH